MDARRPKAGVEPGMSQTRIAAGAHKEEQINRADANSICARGSAYFSLNCTSGPL